jgi:hypothetical protein
MLKAELKRSCPESCVGICLWKRNSSNPKLLLQQNFHLICNCFFLPHEMPHSNWCKTSKLCPLSNWYASSSLGIWSLQEWYYSKQPKEKETFEAHRLDWDHNSHLIVVAILKFQFCGTSIHDLMFLSSHFGSRCSHASLIHCLFWH